MNFPANRQSTVLAICNFFFLNKGLYICYQSLVEPLYF